MDMSFNQLFVVAEKPTKLAAVVSQWNCSTVSITVSWEPPVNTPTGYVIYYQHRGGEVMSESVDEGEAYRHTLDGIQRGVTYNISIVALSHHLPSLLVGPVTVYQGICETCPLYKPIISALIGSLLITETQPEVIVHRNTLFSVVCTVVAEYDGQPLNTTITWTRITISPTNNTSIDSVLAVQKYTEREASVLNSSTNNDSGSGVNSDHFSYSADLCGVSFKWGYRSVLNSTENITNNTVIYRCTATTLGNTSFSDSTVVLLGSSFLLNC